RILDLVCDHDLSEFEIEHEGLRLKVRKDPAGAAIAALPAHAPAQAPGHAAPAYAPASVGMAAGAVGDDTGSDTGIELAVVKSPIVGTFYRSSEPNAAPFVEIGSAIKKGEVLCIIEAMKLMNEIDSEYD